MDEEKAGFPAIRKVSSGKRKRNCNPRITGIFHARRKLQPVVWSTRIISRFVITWHPVGRATYGQVVGHTDCMHQRGRGCRAPREDTRSNPIRWEWGWCVTYCDKLCQTLRRRRRLMPANQLANGNIITVGGTVVCVCTRVCARARERDALFVRVHREQSLDRGVHTTAGIIITRARPCHLVSRVDEALLKRTAILTTTAMTAS